MDALEAVCARFSLGTVRDARYLPDGLMNQNWRVTTRRGTFAVKQIHDGTLEQARRNLRVVAELAAAGVAVPAPLLADGDAVAEIGEYGYCATPWIPGDHLAGTDLINNQARHLGHTLGTVHLSLARIGSDLLSPAPTGLPGKVTSAAAACAEAERYRRLAASQEGGSSAFDDEVVGWLDQRIALINAHVGDEPKDDCALAPVGWTHGDFQHRNLLWAAGHVAAVLDWDKLRVRTLGEEIARTATLQFGGERGWLDLTKVAQFTAGYRDTLPISDEALADAVYRLWWKRLTDFWQLDFHYNRHDYSCDHLFFSGERFLHWWTPRRDDVVSTFVQARVA
ncbi:MAG TPA: phosphotransferase [Candidatus Limnocylindrales bacterium]|nr:phosphotransferase [Candidatus Limnocylindrales bacterium]